MSKRRHKRVPERFEMVADFGPELRGLGGLQTTHVRPLKGSTFGPASKCRRLSADERRAVVEQMQREGKL